MLKFRLPRRRQSRPPRRLLKWVTMLNAQWGAIEDGLHWLFRTQPVVDRVVADGKVLGPIVQDMLSDTDNARGRPGAARSTTSRRSPLPSSADQGASSDYAKLQPLINQVQSDMQKPEIKAAVALLQAKLGAHNVAQVLAAAIQMHAKKETP
jgi:hypothetical protein